MTTNLTIDQFNGNAVTFRGDAWVNATQMARPFEKQPGDFLRLQATSAFIAALAADLGSETGNPVTLFEAVKGIHADGRQQGTWMHPDLALEFARWLSPEFAIWTNRVIRRVLSGQSVEVPVAALAQAIDRMTATLQGFDARLSALEAVRVSSPVTAEPRPPQERINNRLLVLMNHGSSMDVPTTAYALGVNLQDFYAWLRLKHWIKPGTTEPTRAAIAKGSVRELIDGTRYVRTLITAKGLQALAQDFGRPHCFGPFLGEA